MLIDVRLHPRDAGRGAHDVQARPQSGRRHIARLYPRDTGRGQHDVQLRPATLLVFVPDGGGGGFPTQYSGLRIRKTGSTIDLCLVATADAPTGMGGQFRMRKNGVTYCVYIVETTDPDASPVRVRTGTGVKAVRLKT